MLRKGFIKPEISIEKLGKRKFWTGIIIGTASSFVLAYFLNYSREALRMITSTTSDLLILSDQAFRLYDLFFAALATSIGFGFTIIIWLVGRKAGAGKRHFQILAVSNVWLVSFIALMAVSRMGITLTMMLYSHPAYDNHLNLIKDFWPMLILIPVYIYYSHWNAIRLISGQNIGLRCRVRFV